MTAHVGFAFACYRGLGTLRARHFRTPRKRSLQTSCAALVCTRHLGTECVTRAGWIRRITTVSFRCRSLRIQTVRLHVATAFIYKNEMREGLGLHMMIPSGEKNPDITTRLELTVVLQPDAPCRFMITLTARLRRASLLAASVLTWIAVCNGALGTTIRLTETSSASLFIGRLAIATICNFSSELISAFRPPSRRKSYLLLSFWAS